MRIVYTGPFDPMLCDGISGSMFDLMKFLKYQGHEVYIISFMHDNHLTRQVLQYILKQPKINILSRGKNYCNYILKEINIYFEILPLNRNQILGCHHKVLQLYVKIIKQYHDSYFFTVDTDSTCLIANSIVNTSSAHFIRSPSPCIKFYDHFPLYKKILMNQLVFSVSRFAKNELNRVLNVHSLVWEPFIDANRVRSMKKNKNHGKIGYYSAGSHKGDKLINRLISELPHYCFVIIGNNYQVDSRHPNVIAIGGTTNLKDFYGKISLLLVPSIINEGYSRVIIEASFNGIPVIANKIGGIPEALGNSGIMIDIDSSEDKMIEKYISAITRLLDNSSEYVKYQKKAKNRAQEYEKKINRKSLYYNNKYFQRPRFK